MGYERILGVTGTLSSLGDFEKTIIKNEYNIREQTLMPSLYGKRDANFDLGVHFEQGKDNYFRKIAHEAKQMCESDRATLIFFDNEERLREFESSYGQSLSADSVTSGNVEHIDHYVKQATRSRKVTLFPRVFGRGLDFRCYDKKVLAQFGVHVIQTFLSEDVSEEIQIKGRTCRQGNPGSYKMILLAEDLVEWNKLKNSKEDKKIDDPKSETAFITIEELQQCPSDTLYATLHEKRVTWFTEFSRARSEVVKSAIAYHSNSQDYQTFLRQANNNKLLQFLNNMSAVSSSRFHVAFCLDESYSMKNDWGALDAAYRSFLDTIAPISPESLVSVVQFSCTSRSVLELVSLKRARKHRLVQEEGMTQFIPALRDAQRLLERGPPSHTPLLVFMTDGASQDNAKVQCSILKLQVPNLQSHFVYFQNSPNPKPGATLQAMASIMGGQYHLSDKNIELAQTFAAIASEITDTSA